MRRLLHNQRDDSGASAVEFTLVFLFLVLPLILFGIQLMLSVSARQQVTAAARDGAREAIVQYSTVDVGGPGSQAVRDAVTARTAFEPDEIEIRCKQYGTASPPTTPCSTAVPNRDAVEVRVTMPSIRVIPAFGIFSSLFPGTVTGVSSEVVVNP